MRRILHNVFSYAFISLFAVALIWAYVAPFVYERILNPLALLLGVPVVFILFIYAVKKILATEEQGLKKYNRIIVVLYLIFQAIILSMDTLNFSDGAEIENEAHYMLNYGKFSGERYFLVYPNNINPKIIVCFCLLSNFPAVLYVKYIVSEVIAKQNMCKAQTSDI